MVDKIAREKKKLSKELEDVVDEAQELVREMGLDPRPVNYWIVDNDEMNEIAAYGGVQKRYPHWRWGMQYDRQSKQDQYIGGRIFELVNNDTPCNAFLQMSNTKADQKLVITHVEGHSDFFANNKWFQDEPDASGMFARHADQIEEYMEDPDIKREDVERWIDHCLCLEDNIDQYSDFVFRDREEGEEDNENDPSLENLGLSDEIEDLVFGEDYFGEEPALKSYLEDTHSDVLAFLLKNGKQYSERKGESVEFEDWQVDILDMLREEAYYIAPHKMTNVMNEGWAAWTHSILMSSEGFANENEIFDFANKQSSVLGSQGFNPYKLGKTLWEHIENTVNRREVVDRLLRIDGITPDNFHRKVDFQEIHETIDRRDSNDIVERNYSLTRPQNQGFIQDISLSNLRKMNRYIVDRNKYENASEALDGINYEAGWKRMREVRETHNDVMFIDEFLTQEFVDGEEYFSYEYRATHQEFQIASRDVEDVKKKLLLKYTNFGKPVVEVGTGNFNNSGELLLLHQYNGVMMNMEKATSLLERIFEMWGRPVNLATIGKIITEQEMDYAYSEGVEPKPEEVPVRIRYDGEDFEELDLEQSIEDKIQAEEIDYDTKPESWV